MNIVNERQAEKYYRDYLAQRSLALEQGGENPRLSQEFWQWRNASNLEAQPWTSATEWRREVEAHREKLIAEWSA